jgi:hypothetical protein
MATVINYQNFITLEQTEKILNNNLTVIDQIVRLISDHLNIDRSRFEEPEIITYCAKQGQKLHVDYYTGVGLEKTLECGGNRTHTIIVDLNTVEDGGFWFPWLQHLETSQLGKLTVINYSSLDSRERIESEYQIFPSKKSTRQLLKIHVRECDLTKKYSDKIKNLHYYSKSLQKTELDIECGPTDDRRTLHLELEPNNKIGTGLVVGFTSGIDSSLLLYLLATLNSYQTIPYIIQPVVVDNRLGSGDYSDNRFWNPINESWTSILRMIKFIRSEIPNGMIQDPTRYTVNPNYKRYYQTSRGLHDYFLEKNKFGPNRYIDLYEAVLENIPELKNAPDIIYDSPKPWRLPFGKIQKQHVIDIIIDLSLEKIFEITSKCPIDHSTLTESCDLQWQCMERRLGFVKLGQIELGEQYLLNHDK